MTSVKISLWPERWPSIALQECIDKVEAAPLAEQAKVRFELPCRDCPESTRCLNARRKELGPLLFDREILTMPRSSESSLFPREMIEPMLRREQQLVQYWRRPYGDEDRYAIVQAWDLAWSEKTGGDWLVAMTGRLDRETGQRRLLDMGRWQRLSFDEQVRLIDETWRRFEADMVVIEADASQRVWTQHMGRNTAVPVVPHTAAQKRDFAVGVPGLLILLENRKWEFPFARDGRNADVMDTFLSELEAFGWTDGKLEGIGEHDDTVMCWWHLNWGMDRLLVPTRQHRRGAQPSSAYI